MSRLRSIAYLSIGWLLLAGCVLLFAIAAVIVAGALR